MAAAVQFYGFISDSCFKQLLPDAEPRKFLLILLAATSTFSTCLVKPSNSWHWADEPGSFYKLSLEKTCDFKYLIKICIPGKVY
jgi:hypothetical protein